MVLIRIRLKRRYIGFYLENNMGRISQTPLLVLLIALGLFIGQKVYSQELTPLSKLAQDYVMRINEEGFNLGDATIVNPENVLRNAVVESIDTVTKTVDQVESDKDRVVENIREAVKRDIDDSIIEIRKSTDRPAHELQDSIDDERTRLFENITDAIERMNPIEVDVIDKISLSIEDSLVRIKEILEKESGAEVDFEKSKEEVDSALSEFEEILLEKKKTIESREGDLVFRDTDNDGLSDYDELYIYKTNPENEKTKPGEKTDGQKIREGIDPLSDNEQRMRYQDPREDKESFVSSSYKVDKVQFITDEKEKLFFEGVALPNTYVTLFIYSNPIVAIVRTDNSGVWVHELDQKLENGEHQMYVATVDGSGKIVARSNPILFTKTADAASLGITGSAEKDSLGANFLKGNLILIVLASIIAAMIFAMMFAGNHRNIKAAVSDLRNEIEGNQ